MSVDSEEAAAAVDIAEAVFQLDEIDISTLCDEEHPPMQHLPLSSPWFGFKIVSDSIDMNITPSFQRSDKVKQSLNYVLSYAVKDRLDLSHLSDVPPPSCQHKAEDLLPSAQNAKETVNLFPICIFIFGEAEGPTFVVEVYKHQRFSRLGECYNVEKTNSVDYGTGGRSGSDI